MTMKVIDRKLTRFVLDGQEETAYTRIEQVKVNGESHFRAELEGSSLRGTFGGTAESIEMALEYIGLAMQAEGADEIEFADPPLHQ